MADLQHIPTEEMVADRADALVDAQNCRKALAVGVTSYSGGSVIDRLNSNLQQIRVIDAELARRSASPLGERRDG